MDIECREAVVGDCCLKGKSELEFLCTNVFLYPKLVLNGKDAGRGCRKEFSAVPQPLKTFHTPIQTFT